MKVDWVVIGAGFTGATLAERLASQLDQKVLVIEKRDHIGGNSYDCYDKEGILIHKYGSHTFHTNSAMVWNYLSQFTEWRPYFHHVLVVVDGKKVPVPFNLNSIYTLFPKKYAEKLEELLIQHFGFGVKVPILKLREKASGDLSFLAEYIYQKVFYRYTLKHWELKPEELDASVTARVPVYISRDNRYFQDIFQGIPMPSYTALFSRMLNHPNIKLLLNTDYREVIDEIKFKRMIYTGPIDAFFDYRHGLLPYRSLYFDFVTKNQEYFQEAGTINYPNDYEFTRILEQKHLTGQISPKTTITFVYPQQYNPGKTDPYYPIPRAENRQLYNLYLKEAEQIKDRVLFAGWLADYKYYNMDQAVARALTLFKEIAEKRV
ncbi:UDP-galactopyranose mutase [Effusibacillus lacus]|uniref:UDP-galactopyranose mutase n=1 Tax=Effusibacillus lacus TaxID=1348429 RepID=A0A292YLP0_9BACL|nr:UDP-galactopyranose mutase [Effusibacillus lacus]TCS71203.1 UDP-galactopyranose mutase [Effusibacillus lacus]GAX89831.1 UDP-galactopyranose mutase [Effusibacillus lacus]